MAQSTTEPILTKEQKREAKRLRQAEKRKSPAQMPHELDAGCVIHGSVYDWQYVEKLYNQVTRFSPIPVRFHVWTEHDRSVPPHMIKHILEPWSGVRGARKAWWYKMQLFNSQHHAGELLYFDLDVILLCRLDWIIQESTDYFWTIRDFRYLQRAANITMNSSIMWWDTRRYDWIWQDFLKEDIDRITRRYHGDQDYLHAHIPMASRRYYPDQTVISYRWQALDGGFDFRTRRHREPGTGVKWPDTAGAMIFHGRPKPHSVTDHSIIQQLWA